MKTNFIIIFLMITLLFVLNCDKKQSATIINDKNTNVKLIAGLKDLDTHTTRDKALTYEEKNAIEREIRDTPLIIPLESKEISLKDHHINIDIINQNSTVKISQSLKNNGNSPVEGTFIFPIPKDSSVSNFAMYMNDKKISGKIMDKEEANVVYQSIVRKLKDPGILEYLGNNLFKAKIFPIPPKKESKMEIEYTGLLSYDNNLVKLVYPLNFLKKFQFIEGQVAITINLSSEQNIKSVYSPTHKISSNLIDEHHAKISFEGGLSEIHDFVLYYSISNDEIAMNMLSYNDGSDDKYFFLLAAPNYVKKDEKVQKKDIVIVMDSSGSMEGKKIKQAKDAVLFIINALNEGDRFNLIDFDDDIKLWNRQLIPFSKEALASAKAFLDKVDASGSTNIHDALIQSLNDLSNENPTYILFITDGLPTTGNVNEKEIIQHVANKSSDRVRLFTFGVGYDVNTHLLDQIAEKNHGLSQYVEPEENIETIVASLYRKIANPALSNVQINFSGIEPNYIYPKAISELFYGSQLIMVGRYKGSEDVKVTLNGKVNDENKTFTLDTKLSPNNSTCSFLPRLWAERRIGYLLDEIRINTEAKEVVDEIKKLSIKYGIVTPYTSYLVTEQDGKDRPLTTANIPNSQQPSGGNQGHIYLPKKDKKKTYSDTQRGYKPEYPSPNASPAYKDSDYPNEKSEDEMANFEEASKDRSSKRAVQLSKSLSDQKHKEQIEYSESSSVKVIDNKTFYLKSNIWIDNEYNESMKLNEIQFGSDEYFKLISENPEVAKYASIGKEVIFIFKNKAYKIKS